MTSETARILTNLRGSNSGRPKNFFLFSETSRPVVGPTQPPIQLAKELFPGTKRPVREADHSDPSSAKVMNKRSSTSAPPIIHSQDNYKYRPLVLSSQNKFVSGDRNTRSLPISTHRIITNQQKICVCFWRGDSPPPPLTAQWARPASFTRFLHHTQLRITVGRTPLDE
jgi:hypothetical protein